MRAVVTWGLSLAFLAGCQTAATTPSRTASAILRDGAGQTVGRAVLSEQGPGTRIEVDVKGLPAGVKGVHVHEVGSCDPPPFSSAGAHFNPSGKKHGTMNPGGAHGGDLPNIEIAANGTGRLVTVTSRLTLAPGPTSVFDANGSAILIHAAPDDYRTDPAGNSGARIACGVIVAGD